MEIAVPIATRLAAKLGVPANPIEAVMNARDKHATRRISAAAGLPTPKHASIEGVSDLKPAADEVGFPAVLKPVGMFQSMGVVIVDSMSKLVEAYDTVRELQRRAPPPPAPTTTASKPRLGVKMVLEEFLDGEEQVVDIVMQDGECVYASVTDNWAATTSFFDCQGKFNETGAAPLRPHRRPASGLIGLGVASAKALGFQLGVFLNLKYTSRGAGSSRSAAAWAACSSATTTGSAGASISSWSICWPPSACGAARPRHRSRCARRRVST